MRPLTFLTLALASALLLPNAEAARLEVLKIPGVTLRDNPLGDPPARRVAVFVPEGSDNSAPLPLAIYLPGWGSSSEEAIAEGTSYFLARVVDQLAARKLPLRL